MKIKLILGALAFVLSASPYALHAEEIDAKVASVTGTAYTINAAGQSKKITEGETIPAGSTIRTETGSTVGLNLVPGATTVVAPESKMTVKNLDYSKAPDGTPTRTINLKLLVGTLFSSLAKRDGHSSFSVSTPEGVAAARGTDWSVSYSAGAGISVSTADGTVELTLPNGKVIEVPAGKVTTSKDGTTTVTATMSPEQVAAIIGAIKEAGFTPAGGPGNANGAGGTGGEGGTFNNDSQNSNPANISVQPTVSPNQ